MSEVNAPQGRKKYGSVWTGSEYIVWGGTLANDKETNTGGIYDPEINQWFSMTTEGAPTASDYSVAVWTGTHVIFWSTSGGALYNPETDTWTPLRTNNSPSGQRTRPLAVWTGSQLIILGGNNSAMNTGGIWTP